MGAIIKFTRKEWGALNLAIIDYVSLLGNQLTKVGKGDCVKNVRWDSRKRLFKAKQEQFDVEIQFENDSLIKFTCGCTTKSHCIHRAEVLMYIRGHKHTLEASEEQEDSASETGSISQLVQEKVGSELPSAAQEFLETADAWFKKKASVINGGTLCELCGRAVYRGYNDGNITLYPSNFTPANAMEFLVCLILAADKMGFSLPAPIPSVVEKSAISQIRQQWDEEKIVKEWKHSLDTWSLEKNSPSYPEMRLRLYAREVILESRTVETEEFKKAVRSKVTSLFSQRRNWMEGNLPLGLEMVLRAVTDTYGSFNGVIVRPRATALVKSLSRLLALPDLFSRHVAGENGEPLTMVKEPLRWRLTEPEDKAFYCIDLIDSQGHPVPLPVALIPGATKYYITAQAVYTLENWPNGLEQDALPLHIPVRALESTAGLTALRILDLPVPEKIASRVRVLKPTVAIRAKMMVPSYSKSEYLRLAAYGTYASQEIPDVLWTGDSWMKKLSREKQPVEENHDDLLQIDNSLLDQAADWLREWPLKQADNFWESHELEQCIRSKDWAGEFLTWLQQCPKGCKVELSGELASLANGEVAGTVRLDIEESSHGIDWFDLHVVLDVTDTELTQAEIDLLLKAQGHWVRLTGKGWRKLELTVSEEQRAELAALGLALHDFKAEKQRLHALQLGAVTKNGGTLLGAKRVEQVRRRIEEIQTRVTPPVPPAIIAQMRPYQVEGFHFLSYLTENKFGGVLADDMGLGKTLQALTWIAWLREHKQLQAPVLVICPKSVQDGWRAESVKFFPELKVEVWTRGGAGKLEDKDVPDLLVIHYTQLRLHAKLLASRTWGAVILDEAQAIKNPSSHSARIACSLVAAHRLALTGTPIENRLMDLWSIFSFAMPGVLGNRTSFSKQFDCPDDPLARKRLAARTRPFLLRRTKKEVESDLPERIEEDLLTEFDGVQAALYQAELKRARAMILNVTTDRQLDKLRFNILTSLLRLRQICCHPHLLGLAEKNKAKKSKVAGKGTLSMEDASSAKVVALFGMLEPLMEEGQKVLVFSQFVGMLEIIEKEIEVRGWKQFKLTGETEDRGPLIASFQKHQGEAIFLISLKAGGSGLNLTAASYVILFDPWWNPAVEAQAIDRTHRIGQKNTVFAYRLLIKGTIEEKIRLLQKQKGAVAHDILGEENFSKALSLDDFRFLLGEGENG